LWYKNLSVHWYHSVEKCIIICLVFLNLKSNNPEYSIPAAVIGAPVALAATPMIVSYALFPFASGASYLMPELSTELAGATSQAGFAEIDGIASKLEKHYTTCVIIPKACDLLLLM
jgi:hypothetical protein